MPHEHPGVDAYIKSRSRDVAPLLARLRSFVHEALPGATEELQYGVPAFLNNHGVAVIYLFGSKAHVNFGFLKSAQLDDPQGLLLGSGNPSKHLKIAAGDPIEWDQLRGFVDQCAKLRT